MTSPALPFPGSRRSCIAIIRYFPSSPGQGASFVAYCATRSEAKLIRAYMEEDVINGTWSLASSKLAPGDTTYILTCTVNAQREAQA